MNDPKLDLPFASLSPLHTEFEDGLRIELLSENDRKVEVATALYQIGSCHESLCNYDKGESLTHHNKNNVDTNRLVHMALIQKNHFSVGEILRSEKEKRSPFSH